MLLLLVGYATLPCWGGSLAPWVNITSRVDSAVFGRFVYLIDPASGRGHDPEGLLGTLPSLPSLATALLGLRAGCWLPQGRMKTLLIAGVSALLIGALWALWQPLNKNRWTPSFVLWRAGWSMLALLLFHVLIDRYGWPPLGRRFGVNASAACAGSELMQIVLPALGWQEPLYRHLFADPLTPLAGAYVASLAWALAFVLMWWLIVYLIDRRRCYPPEKFAAIAPDDVKELVSQCPALDEKGYRRGRVQAQSRGRHFQCIRGERELRRYIQQHAVE